MQWRLGADGQTAGPAVTHRFRTAGRHDVTLTVWDENGATDQAVESIDVALPGIPILAEQEWVSAFGEQEWVGG